MAFGVALAVVVFFAVDAAGLAAVVDFFAGAAVEVLAVEYTLGAGGAPILAGVAASFECFNRSRYEEGDHVIFVGEVECCTHHPDASPLVYHGGKFYTERLLSPSAVDDEKTTSS